MRLGQQDQGQHASGRRQKCARCARSLPQSAEQDTRWQCGDTCGEVVPAKTGNSRCVRIFTSVAPSRIAAMSFRSPPQPGQCSRSTLNTRRSSVAHHPRAAPWRLHAWLWIGARRWQHLPAQPGIGRQRPVKTRQVQARAQDSIHTPPSVGYHLIQKRGRLDIGVAERPIPHPGKHHHGKFTIFER